MDNPQAAKQKLVAAQVAAAAANAAVKAAAFSPRTRGRAKLASQILDAESDQQGAMKVLEECTEPDRPYSRAGGQKGIITDAPLSARSRRQANGGSSPTHPTYPASPSVAISAAGHGHNASRAAASPDGSNVRSCSGDVRPRQHLPGQSGQVQPLSARQKAGHLC